MATKQRVSSARWKQAFPVLPSLVKMRVGRGKMAKMGWGHSFLSQV